MIRAGAEVLFYGLAAALSALVLSATFVAIRSERPRTNAIAFLSGFLAGTVIACGLGLALGEAAVDRLDSHETFEGVLTLALGLALIAVGLRARRAPLRTEASGSRATAILAGLRNVGPATTFSMAGLLGFGGPKRLLLTFLAMASASQAGLRDIVNLTLVSSYVVISTLLVSVPVGIVVLAGDRADAIFARGQSGQLHGLLDERLDDLALRDGLDDLALHEDLPLAVPGGDPQVRLAGLARTVDHTAHDRHPQRHVEALEPGGDLFGEGVDVDLGPAAGGARHDLQPALAQVEGLQDLHPDLDLLHRRGGQRHADGVADAVGQQGSEGHRGLDGALEGRAGLGDPQVQRVVALLGEQAVGLTMTTGSWCLTEILMSRKPCSSNSEHSQRADSTSASGVALPCFSSSRLSSEPAFTPIRIGVPQSARPWRSRPPCRRTA